MSLLHAPRSRGRGLPLLRDFGVAALCLASADASAQDVAANAYQVRALVSTSNWTVLSSEILAPIARLARKPGERFHAGDVLVTFECAAHEAQRAAYAADERQARAQLDAQHKLLELGSVGALDVEIARAGLDRARASLALQDIQLRRCKLLAPYDGSVVRWGAQAHQTVAVGEEVIEIVGTRGLELELVAPSTWLEWLRIDQAITARIDETGAEVRAVVIRIGARIDPVSQTVPVYAAIAEGSGGLAPGMSGTAEVLR
jgi:membrane fusion protein (multidrug efflux system)